ncbi:MULTISPECIES: hypothetical protein [Bacillus subtilis group]|uniref:hypothetical protein n=1 Tax=Bacillus subtilis group TaxID=653685 RepID=UPI0021D81E47|nr:MULTISPECIES: hypothetical protein [Bacillus subtilis group]MCY9308786.1 hypothetical protein [Bacillus inaquosorum]
MRTEEKRTRKVRSDKRRDVKPVVDLELYDCIARISYITNSWMKDVGELFCKNGLYSKKVIDHLSKDFRRDYRFDNTFYIGNPDIVSERARKKSGTTKRLTIRFLQDTYDDLADLAYSLDVTVSTAASILLHASIRDTDIINEYISNFVEDSLDPNRKKQLQLVLEYTQKENPYPNDEVTLAQLISYIMDEFMGQSRNIKKAVETWLDRFIDKD